jgi:LacI family transcriptional regulator
MQQKQDRPTILDVAERAGVSVGTVSNVLNGKVRVSPELRGRVRAAVEDLSYTQNLLAQSLRRRRAAVVGLCVPHTSIAYFAKLVEVFEGVASSRGAVIMQTLSRDDPATELQRVSSLLDYHVGGIVLVPTAHPEKTLALVARSGTPMVVVDRPVARGRFDEVSFDNAKAMTEALHGMIARGHTHILFVVRRRALATTRLRVAALHRAARLAGPHIRAEVLECNSYDPDVLTARFRDALEGPSVPTAIIVSNSMLAACMLRAFRALGIACPADMSLLTFDEPEWAALVEPPLSIVRQPTTEVAHAAWEFLINRMEDETAPVRDAVFLAELVMRGSVGAPRRSRPHWVKARLSGGRQDG